MAKKFCQFGKVFVNLVKNLVRQWFRVQTRWKWEPGSKKWLDGIPSFGGVSFKANT
jgi:hypothetical protein